MPVAAAHLLGVDIAAVIGPERVSELLQRWPGKLDLLIRELVVRADTATTSEVDRGRTIAALSRGLSDSLAREPRTTHGDDRSLEA